MERDKFNERSKHYFKALEKVLSLGWSEKELVHQFPLMSGEENIARYLALYEHYKMTSGIAGHIAEVGVWNGASLLYLTKLARIFEPYSYTVVHGFDWFQGMHPTNEKTDLKSGIYTGDYEKLVATIEAQSLQNCVAVHKLDVAKDLPQFFEANPSLMFKLVFLDCSIFNVIEAALENLWPRLVRGGVLVLDEFNVSATPEETLAVRKFFGDAAVRTLQWSRQPSGYVIKE